MPVEAHAAPVPRSRPARAARRSAATGAASTTTYETRWKLQAELAPRLPEAVTRNSRGVTQQLATRRGSSAASERIAFTMGSCKEN